MKQAIKFCLLLMVIVIGAAIESWAVPTLPHSFYGTVKKDGANVPDGTVVSAWIGGTQYASTTTTTYGANSVGVLVIGYESDTLPILTEVGDDPPWPEARWWGVEATPINAILSNSTAAQSAVHLNYTGAQQFGGQGERYNRLAQNSSVQHTIQTSEGSFAYDAVWIMARAIAETNGGSSTALRAAIPRVASSYTGVTGNTTLSAVGDRAYANYDFWTVKSQNGTYVKVKTAQFRTDPRSGTATVQPSTTTAVAR